MQGENSARHCFLLRNLIPMKFFVIIKLKMCTTGKIFAKVCLKTIRDTFIQYVTCDQTRNRVKT